jgi:deoxyribonuclease-4
MDNVIVAVKKWYPGITEEGVEKVRKSKTTQPFMDHIVATRKKMDLVVKGPLRFDEAVQQTNVEGHPDARTDTQVFEVKMTGMLKENWQQFLYQVFAYGALAPEVKDVYLVMPMQEIVWHYNIEGWANRAKYSQHLQDCSTRLQGNAAGDALVGCMIREMYHIGNHIHKQKTLADTVRAITDYSKPYQFFLGGPQNSKLSIGDAELAEAAQAVAESGAQIYIHSQYLINLCQTPGEKDDYHTALLIKNLQYANAAGFKGVVVHVGKYTDKPLPEAIENMRKNLQTAMAHATEACPILLETPAGQGTETLQTYTEFVEFVLGFHDKRLRVCVDSCHVFACGYRPIDYIKRITTYNKKLLKLVHYNDSATPCGSHLDRHAFMGTGHVGMEEMTQIAEVCHHHKVPMVIE